MVLFYLQPDKKCYILVHKAEKLMENEVKGILPQDTMDCYIFYVPGIIYIERTEHGFI